MTTRTKGLLYLSKSDILHLGGDTSALYMDAIHQALSRHAAKEFVQPLKPYLRWRGAEGHIADRIIAMPAYLGGAAPMAGLKWIGSKHDNPSRHGLERASALIVLNDAETHYPIAIMEGSLISGMRTAAVTAVAARYLAREGFQHVACIGCGPIARMQLTTLLEQFPSISIISLFDLSPVASARLREELQQRFPRVEFLIAASAEQAIRRAEMVVTCTVASEPYIPFEWLARGTFVSNVSIMDVHKEVFLQVDKVVVDDWDQSNREKKTINQLVLEGRFSREKLHAELGEIVIGRRPGRESADEIILLNPMGMAIEDIACAQAVYQKAVDAEVGTWLSLE
ncbi:2,3-diaminopropionate biosynthesis protein SbnB [Archangium lansingense]|uniref:2,3-diaminopropionate biosynthesis protein SbnB n=1 Tax=Archangium lansingense TaxID=2995310 RepID=A0ABT4ACX3_9BACT|nr:2,3-diaminopropionate biosynthesis protein SbnB [Archangium lansinium]MCY1079527.1 2,3-diaminopropionate biosynthesis protein SbnB [Archangium lansinium]